MALAKIKYDVELPSSHSPVEDIPAPKESTFSSHMPRRGLESLAKYVKGHNWTVNYYGQVLNSQTSLNHFDPFEGNLSQSYLEIKNMVLKVQSPLSYAYDDKTGLGDMSGSANVPFITTPMKGDVFLATVETGEDVLFVVNHAERLTHRTPATYRIDYNSFSYRNSHPDYVDKLLSRVQRTVYHDNRLDNGSKHIFITEDTKNSIDSLLDFMHDSKEHYFASFLQQRTNALGVPGLTLNAIDPILGDFISKTVDTSKYMGVNRFDYEVHNRDYGATTILDSLIRVSLPSRTLNTPCVGFTNTEGQWRRSKLATVQLSGIAYVAMPLVTNKEHRSKTFELTTTPEYDVRTELNYKNQEQFGIKTVTEQGEDIKALFHDLFEENYYIVSKHFYEYLKDNTTYDNISYIELIIADHLKGKVIDANTLSAVVSSWDEWSTLYQFYLLPVMWVIIKTQLGVV